MRFKNFEIRECEKGFRKYEVVKWRQCMTKNGEYSYPIAYIEYSFKEPFWEFKSIGTRYLENREEGLEEYILEYIELLDTCIKYKEKEWDE